MRACCASLTKSTLEGGIFCEKVFKLDAPLGYGHTCAQNVQLEEHVVVRIVVSKNATDPFQLLR